MREEIIIHSSLWWSEKVGPERLRIELGLNEWGCLSSYCGEHRKTPLSDGIERLYQLNEGSDKTACYLPPPWAEKSQLRIRNLKLYDVLKLFACELLVRDSGWAWLNGSSVLLEAGVIHLPAFPWWLSQGGPRNLHSYVWLLWWPLSLSLYMWIAWTSSQQGDLKVVRLLTWWLASKREHFKRWRCKLGIS